MDNKNWNVINEKNLHFVFVVGTLLGTHGALALASYNFGDHAAALSAKTRMLFEQGKWIINFDLLYEIIFYILIMWKFNFTRYQIIFHMGHGNFIGQFS